MKFKYEDRVVLKDNFKKVGTVVAYDSKDKSLVIVDWDNTIKKVEENKLAFESDVFQLEKEFQEEKDRITKKVQEAGKIINEKMKTASNLIKEANEIAKENKFLLKEPYYEDEKLDLWVNSNVNLDLFKQVIEDAGWILSSY